MDNPQAVLEAIDTDRAELIRLAGEFDKARRGLGKAEYGYEKAQAKALVRYEVNYRERFGDKRLPGEDIRTAYIREIDSVSSAWAEYLGRKAEVESLEKVIRIRQSHLSSLQSELAYMTEELRRS